MSCNLWSPSSKEDLHSFVKYLFWYKQALHFFTSYEKSSTYPSLSFLIEKLIFCASSDSYHNFLFTHMQIIFPVETVNECESCLFSNLSWFHKTYVKIVSKSSS